MEGNSDGVEEALLSVNEILDRLPRHIDERTAFGSLAGFHTFDPGMGLFPSDFQKLLLHFDNRIDTVAQELAIAVAADEPPVRSLTPVMTISCCWRPSSRRTFCASTRPCLAYRKY